MGRSTTSWDLDRSARVAGHAQPVDEPALAGANRLNRSLTAVGAVGVASDGADRHRRGRRAFVGDLEAPEADRLERGEGRVEALAGAELIAERGAGQRPRPVGVVVGGSLVEITDGRRGCGDAGGWAGRLCGAGGGRRHRLPGGVLAVVPAGYEGDGRDGDGDGDEE